MPQAYFLAERLLLVCFVSYLGSLASYLANAARRRVLVEKLAGSLALVGLAVHSAGLLARWVANGQVEIFHQALAEGRALSRYEWLWAAVRHPPYTNLYESLLFIAWALMVCYAVIQLRFRLRPLGIFVVTLASLVLSVAFLVSDKQVEPLVPALQSYWILIHVGLLFVSYSLFTIAACLAALFLFKIDVPTPTLGKWFTGAASLFALLAAGRWDRIRELLGSGAFMMSPVTAMGHRVQPVHYFMGGSDKAIRWYVTLPGVGVWLIAAVVLLAAAAVLFHWESRREQFTFHSSNGIKALALAVVALLGGLATMGWRIATMQAVAFDVPGAQLAGGDPGPFRVAMTSNQYAPALLTLVAVAALGFLAVAWRRPALAAALPEEKRLDDMAYRVITIAFPFLSFGIIMGAVWAHESWGRYWGWDPKEVWALITWFVYAAYLHTRITLGWVGKPGAAIAVAGFAVVVFTYMGVNLGLTGEGLHTYGSG